MSQLAATETVVVMFLVITAMGAWDGLVRRNVRTDIDVIQLHIHVRKVPAMIIGAASLVVFVALIKLSFAHVLAVLSGCGRSLPCSAGQVLYPLISSWQTALCVAVAAVLLGQWLCGVRNIHGPYRRHLLAPGVWDSEEELLALIESSLNEHHLPPVGQDTLLDVASWVRQILMVFKGRARETIMRDGHLDAGKLVQVLADTRTEKKFHIGEPALSIVLRTIAQYYQRKYGEAARVWPWRRRFIPY